MSKPLVSIVTTLYNCEKYVRDSVQSVLSQNYDFEFILINDGSTDTTWDIVASFKDDRMILIDHKENQKIPTRRNEAIAIARNKYICIHDGDDESLPGRFEKQANFLEDNPSVFCVGSRAIKIDDKGSVIGEMNYPPDSYSDIINMFQEGILNPMIDSSTMFRAKDFAILGGYSLDADKMLIPDMDLWLRALCAGKRFRNFLFPLIRYRMNPHGMTQKFKKDMILAHIKLIRIFVPKLRTIQIAMSKGEDNE